MREIKFRVFDENNSGCSFGSKINGKMEYNDFAITYDGRFIDHIGDDTYRKASRTNKILMQYTGLKDNNGKEIYEGDYIKGTINIEYKDFEGVIEWNNELQRFDVGNKDEVKSMARISDFEVIGNIYENPELLTNQKN